MVIAPMSSQTASLVEIPAAVKAAAQQINSEGGLNGHPIDVVTCNEPGDPNVATQCAQQAVQDGVLAAVGTYSEFSTNLYPTFAKVGIVNLGEEPLTPADFSNTSSYPITSGLFMQYLADGVLAARQGCKVPTIVAPAGNDPVNNLVKAGAMSVSPSVKVPLVIINIPQPDYAPTISHAIADGADCLVLETPPQDATRIFTAMQQSGHKFKVFSNSGSVTTQALQTMGSAANGVFYETDPQYLANTDPTMVSIAAAIKADNSQAVLDSFSLYAWGATQVLKLAAAHMTAMTPQALAAALPQIGTVSLGFYAPFSFSQPLSVAAYSRLFNTTLYGWVSQDGQYVPMANPNTPVDVKSVLASLG